MAADGQKVSDLVLGVPLVLKYNMATGGFIVVTDPSGGGTILEQDVTVERAVINISGSAGYNLLVPGVAGKSIRVAEVMLIGHDAMNVHFESGYTGTWLTGPLDMAAAGDGFFAGAPDSSDLYHFTTEAGKALILYRDAAGQVGGWLLYFAE